MSSDRPMPRGVDGFRDREHDGVVERNGAESGPHSSTGCVAAAEAAGEPWPSGTVSLQELVARYERRLIEAALARTRGNRARAAKLLNTTERILGYRVQRYGIDCTLYRD